MPKSTTESRLKRMQKAIDGVGSLSDRYTRVQIEFSKAIQALEKNGEVQAAEQALQMHDLNDNAFYDLMA